MGTLCLFTRGMCMWSGKVLLAPLGLEHTPFHDNSLFLVAHMPVEVGVWL